MSITIEAQYEDRVLKPVEPLPLREHAKVRITMDDESGWRASRVRETAGLLEWKGDVETIEHLALDPDLGIEEAS
jgi:predicted DNA-binding antitoxin AbrB/MazE fold protein